MLNFKTLHELLIHFQDELTCWANLDGSDREPRFALIAEPIRLPSG